MQNVTQSPEISLDLHIFVGGRRRCGFLSARLRGRVWRYKGPLLHKKSRRSRRSQLLYSLRVSNASKSVTSLTLERCSSGHSKITLPGTGKPQSWNFDDDIPVEQPRGPFNGSAPFPGPSSRPKEPKIKMRRRKWRWPWTRVRQA